MARSTPEIPNASMADIAFLLLTFFLVTTTIANDKGLSIQLPAPLDPNQPKVEFQQHNLFTIQVNSSDALLVEGEPMDDVSGTTHKRFVQILDIIQNAYYDIWADQAGVTNARYREAASDTSDPSNKEIYDKGREGIPMAISIAEPTKVGG
jgi:hypothetical protein